MQLPRTNRRLMFIAVAFPGIIVLFLGWTAHRCGPTYYAQGYNKNKFMSLRAGMASSEVEAVMGSPLDKVPWHDGTVLWTYSDRADDTCDFWRRWVLFKNDKVEHVISDYWDE